MESLTVTLMFGLGNRFRALASALAIEMDMRIPVTIVWAPKRDCQIGFDDLFEPLKNITRSAMDTPGYICVDHAHFIRLQAQFRRTGIKNAHVQSYCNFFDSPNTNLRSLRPRQEYLDAVSTLFGDKTVVGVQIRRTDHKHSIEHSPTELFLEAMAAYPVTTHFFLATDSNVEKTKLRDIYGSRIIGFDGPLTRWNMEGMKASFTDWLALSKCTEIIGSYKSSFSATAAEFGGVPLRVLRV
jgi:hypothetical protein